MGELSREEEVLVLFGSQRGAAERMAAAIAERLPHELSPESILRSRTGTDQAVTVVPKLVSLDDFLLQEGCRWTRIVIIVVSSFGAGGAPMNARKFRRACEDWIAELKDDGRRDIKFLKGLRFALLGYGDRHYKTYQRNPMVIEEALTMAGASRIGARGESDADTDEEVNEKAVSMWVGQYVGGGAVGALGRVLGRRAAARRSPWSDAAVHGGFDLTRQDCRVKTMYTSRLICRTAMTRT
jgi:sulfite reductase alpha subunit-like flavoprotein